jgi:trigger factor
MKVESVEKEYCQLSVSYEGDPEVVKTKIDEAVASLRSLKIPGFRKGNAPDFAIKAKLAPQIKMFVAREMSIHAMDEIVFETNIKPLGQPKFNNVDVGLNNGMFKCTVEVFKKPDFTVENYTGIEVTKLNPQHSPEELADKSLENIRMRMGDSIPYGPEDTVATGDLVTLSFVATLNGESFDGSVAEGETYNVGESVWDKCIIGMKVDQEKEFDFTFDSATAKVPELIGKVAHFKVTIHMGTKRVPHELNDEFFKEVGVSSIEDLKEKLMTFSKNSFDQQQKNHVRNSVAEKLVSSTEIKVPQFFIEQEMNVLKNRSDLTSVSEDKMRQMAENNIKLSLILDSIRELEPDSVLNETEAYQHLAKHFMANGQDPNTFMSNIQSSGMLPAMLATVKDEFTLQWLADQAKIGE